MTSTKPVVQSIITVVRALVVVLMIVLVAVTSLAGRAVQQTSIDELKAKLNSQYLMIQKTIKEPPSPRQYPLASDYHRKLREWQDELAQSFVAAATTVREILKLDPDSDYWHERLETLELYSQPIRSPEERNVFSAPEVQQSARLLETPAAEYTPDGQAEGLHGDVRLRLVLASDGTVKDIFPIKSLPHGLTDTAMKAARQIKFEPAVRNGKPASQFITLVYEFRNGEARPPYIPKTIF